MNIKKLGILGAVLLGAWVLMYRPDPVRAANGSHAPIVIASNSDFQACNCLASGSGTKADPYIIGPLAINSTPPGEAAVSVDGTTLTKSFTLFNLTISGSGASTSTGIVLNNINPSGQ